MKKDVYILNEVMTEYIIGNFYSDQRECISRAGNLVQSSIKGDCEYNGMFAPIGS